MKSYLIVAVAGLLLCCMAVLSKISGQLIQSVEMLSIGALFMALSSILYTDSAIQEHREQCLQQPIKEKEKKKQ